MTKQMRCATEVAKWLGKKQATDDVMIYVDGKRYTIDEKGVLVYDIDAEPKKYLDYAGDFMSMSFEGFLYDLLNYGFELDGGKAAEELEAIFRKYGKYSEQGNAWNLSLYDL